MAAPVPQLLTGATVRQLAQELDLHPSKGRGQNFVVDPNTIRRLVRLAQLHPGQTVLEVGPGLGSLTLGLLGEAERVIAVEIDDRLAHRLPRTVAEFGGDPRRLEVIHADALSIGAADLGDIAPSALVANLPYNVAVPILLHLLVELPMLRSGLVMVQQEVAKRLVAEPGDKLYGIPSVKLRWFAQASYAGDVPSSVFWPAPRVMSGLVQFDAHPAPTTVVREWFFTVVDVAFGQRRKMLRASLRELPGLDQQQVGRALDRAGLAGTSRPEQLSFDGWVALCAALSAASER